MTDAVEVTDNKDALQFEARAEGQVAELLYRLRQAAWCSPTPKFRPLLKAAASAGSSW